MRLALCRLIPLTSLLQGSRTWPQSHRSLSSPMKNLGSRYVSAPARERRLIALLLHEVHKFLTAHEVHESREGRAHRIRSYARSYQSASEPAGPRTCLRSRDAHDTALANLHEQPKLHSKLCTPHPILAMRMESSTRAVVLPVETGPACCTPAFSSSPPRPRREAGR